MFLFDTVELSELIKLGHQRVNHLHAFEKLSAALLIATVLLTFGGVVLALEVGDLVLESAKVTLFGSELHDFLPELVDQSI